MMMTMLRSTSSSAGAARPLLFNNSTVSFWPLHASRTHWLPSSVPFTLSLAAAHCKNSAGDGLNAPEGLTMVMEADDSDEFVDVGLIRNTHGVKGELKVMSLTDFPEQRFETPGIRWVGFYRMGKLVGLRKIELLCGRKIMQGKDSAWLLTFQGIDSMEKASEFLGATILVKNEDRPSLNADQFYIPELIGMSVQLKDSGKVIGSIVDIFNSGASDLLRVKLAHPEEKNDGRYNERKEDLIWIPFVKEIVPTVDIENRFVGITPPQGLLELNLRSKRPLKQELRKEALRSKRKLQERMSGVRKKVLALKQDHILSGLTDGDESQREALKMQLLTFDFSSFKRAMETLSPDFKSSLDSDAYAFTSAIAPPLDWKGLRGWLGASPKELECSDEVNNSTWRSWRRGLGLVAEGRVAIVALATGDMIDEDLTDSSLEANLENQAGQLLAMQELAEMISGEKPLIPWVVVTTEASSEYIQNLLKDESHFGLSEQQVHFVKLSCLPFVSRDVEGAQKVLMESQWRIVAGAGGDGQVISDLDDSGVLNNLMEMGIDYIHLCAIDKASAINTDPAIFGVMEEQNACVGIRVASDTFEGDHGILCLQKRSVDGRGHSIFIPESEKAAGSVKGTSGTFEHFTVLKSHDVQKAGSLALEDYELVYRVPLNCNYTLSAEYLRHLSLQRHGFIYEGELKETGFTESREESSHEIENFQDNAMQLKCSLHNALMFCLPSKVALLNCDNIFVDA